MNHLAALVDRTRDVATPFIAVDPMVLEANIAGMQGACDEVGVALRPHIKTHKSSEIARSQLGAGAIGVTCATLSEAVALGEAGCRTDVFVSTPVFFDDPKRRLVHRATELHDRMTVTVDGEKIAASVLSATPSAVSVMVEVDSGLHRTGAAAGEAGRLARMLGGRFAGFCTHGGHGYAPGGAAAAGLDERHALAEAARAFGAPVRVSSAGSTPTARFALGEPVTELRPGTYVFGDHQQVLLGACEPSDVAAGVVATVIHSSDGRFVLDAGAKALSKDRTPWIDSYGTIVGHELAVIVRLNDNHGMVNCDDPPPVGQRVVVVPNHICPVVNLFDRLVIAGGEPAFLAVDLRGNLT